MCRVACCRACLYRVMACSVNVQGRGTAAVVPVQIPVAVQKPVMRPWTFTHEGDPVYTDIRIEHQLAPPFPRDLTIFKE